MILGILKRYWILYYKSIIFQKCVDNLHSSTAGVAIYLRLDGKFHTRTCTSHMFTPDGQKPGENTNVRQSHVAFSRFLAYPSTTEDNYIPMKGCISVTILWKPRRIPHNHSVQKTLRVVEQLELPLMYSTKRYK